MNEYKKIITMPVYNRADYTKEVLDGFKTCYGIEDYTIYIFAEPDCPEVIDVIKSMNTLNIELRINKKRLGLAKNTKQCLEQGYSLTNYNIHFEDDCVPTKDCLEFFEWARIEYENNPDIFSVSATNRTPEVININDIYHQVMRHTHFLSTSWATWYDRWIDIKENWIEEGIGEGEIRNLWSKSALSARKNRFGVHPVVSRTKYIGFLKSTNSRSEKDIALHIENHSTPFWIGDIENVGSGSFHEGDNENISKALVRK